MDLFFVALTIALVGTSNNLLAFDRVWWLIVIGGVTTSLLALRTRTSASPRQEPVIT